MGDDVRHPHRHEREGLLRDPGARAELDDVRRRQDLDVHDPLRGDLVGRRPAHRQGRRLHVQPDHEGHVRADELRQLRREHHLGDGARRHDRRHEDQGADPDHDPAGGADPARAHLEQGLDEKQVKSFANQTDVVGSGPFQLVERKTGQFIRLKANKGYWGGAPKIDELVFRVYTNADALGQALKSGEVDFADALDADVWQSLKNTPGVAAYAAKYYSFNELAFNTGAALGDGTPIGDGHPALKDKRVRRRAVATRSTGRRSSTGCSTGTAPRARRSSRRSTPRSTSSRPSPYTFDLARPTSCSTRPATRRARTASGRCPAAAGR